MFRARQIKFDPRARAFRYDNTNYFQEINPLPSSSTIGKRGGGLTTSDRPPTMADIFDSPSRRRHPAGWRDAEHLQSDAADPNGGEDPLLQNGDGARLRYGGDPTGWDRQGHAGPDGINARRLRREVTAGSPLDRERYGFLTGIPKRHRESAERLLAFFLVHVDTHLLEILPSGRITYVDHMIPGTDAGEVLVSLLSSESYELGETYVLRILKNAAPDAIKRLLHPSKQGKRASKILDLPEKPTTSKVVEDYGLSPLKSQKLTSCSLGSGISFVNVSQEQLKYQPLRNPREIRVTAPLESQLRPAIRIPPSAPALTDSQLAKCSPSNLTSTSQSKVPNVGARSWYDLSDKHC